VRVIPPWVCYPRQRVCEQLFISTDVAGSHEIAEKLPKVKINTHNPITHTHNMETLECHRHIVFLLDLKAIVYNETMKKHRRSRACHSSLSMLPSSESVRATFYNNTYVLQNQIQLIGVLNYISGRLRWYVDGTPVLFCNMWFFCSSIFSHLHNSHIHKHTTSLTPHMWVQIPILKLIVNVSKHVYFKKRGFTIQFLITLHPPLHRCGRMKFDK
jgi:hypothetical protein